LIFTVKESWLEDVYEQGIAKHDTAIILDAVAWDTPGNADCAWKVKMMNGPCQIAYLVKFADILVGGKTPDAAYKWALEAYRQLLLEGLDPKKL
jgi:hypothetical protein